MTLFNFVYIYPLAKQTDTFVKKKELQTPIK